MLIFAFGFSFCSHSHVYSVYRQPGAASGLHRLFWSLQVELAQMVAEKPQKDWALLEARSTLHDYALVRVKLDFYAESVFACLGHHTER